MILFHDLMFSMTKICVCLNPSARGCVYVDISTCSCCTGVPACEHVQSEARSQQWWCSQEPPTLCFEIGSHYDPGSLILLVWLANLGFRLLPQHWD